MNPEKAPRDLTWAAAAVAIASVLIYAAGRTERKLRQAREAVASTEAEKQHQFEMLSGVRKENLELARYRDLLTGGEDHSPEEIARRILGTEIAELHFELDGPWEGDSAESLTDAGAGKTALEDPESRRPKE